MKRLLRKLFWIGIVFGLGYLLGVKIIDFAGFPVGVIVIAVIGSLLIGGFIAGFAAYKKSLDIGKQQNINNLYQLR